MIDPETEELMTRNRARRLPWMRGRFGNDVSLPTLDRWCRPPGLRGIILETLKLGGTVFTSREATLRFISRLNKPARLPVASTRVRKARIDAAERSLNQAGI